MLPQAVSFACAAAVDTHRDTLAALIPRDVAATLWHVATTTEPVVKGGPGGVLSALEQLPTNLVDEVRVALSGRLPDIQVPPSIMFGRETLPPWLGGPDNPPRGTQTSVLEYTRYVCEVAPQRVQILLRIVQNLMSQLVRDAQGRSEDESCARYLAAVVIVASAVTTRMWTSGLEAERAAIGLGLGATVVLARVRAHLAAHRASVTEPANPALVSRPAPLTMVGVTATASRIILGDVAAPRPADGTPDAAFASNGLVVPISGGLVIRTGAGGAYALVSVSAVDSEPEPPQRSGRKSLT
jgi:hypothetical protein